MIPIVLINSNLWINESVYIFIYGILFTTIQTNSTQHQQKYIIGKHKDIFVFSANVIN